MGHNPIPPKDEPLYPNTIGEGMIRRAREEYATDKIDMDEFEHEVEVALDGDAHGWTRRDMIEHRHYVCPWCGATVAQTLKDFNWWCPECGKNATDFAGFRAESVPDGQAGDWRRFS